MKMIITALMAMVISASAAETINHESYSEIETIIFTNTSPVITQTVATVVISGEILDITNFHYDVRDSEGKMYGVYPIKFLVESPKELNGKIITLKHHYYPQNALNKIGAKVEFKTLAMAIETEDNQIQISLNNLSLIGNVKEK